MGPSSTHFDCWHVIDVPLNAATDPSGEQESPGFCAAITGDIVICAKTRLVATTIFESRCMTKS